MTDKLKLKLKEARAEWTEEHIPVLLDVLEMAVETLGKGQHQPMKRWVEVSEGVSQEEVFFPFAEVLKQIEQRLGGG